MTHYTFEIQHSEETFKALAHMQYDLFCRSNRLIRNLITILSVCIAIANIESWWAYPLIGYGWYIHASTYSQANNTARKLARQITETHNEFPRSRYAFEEDGLHVYTLPENEQVGDPLPYDQVAGIGEDVNYLYVFRDKFGGYMMEKDALEDEDAKEFRRFLRKRTGKPILFKGAPVGKLVGFVDRFRKE